MKHLCSWRSLSRNDRKLLIVILVVALLVRLTAAFLLGDEIRGLSGAHDEISYSMLGQRFASGYGMTFPQKWYPWIDANAPQSYYSFTFSFLLATIYKIFGYHPLAARLVMAFVSVGVVFMVFKVACYFFDNRTALLSSAIAAIYAYFIFYGVSLVTETPFILAILTAIYLGTMLVQNSGRIVLWIVFGIALAFSVLLRMAVIFFVPVLFMWMLVQMHDHRQRFYVLIPIVIILLAITPFTIRNYLLWGKFMLLESQFGHVFWNGNHPGHMGNFHPYKVFPIPPNILASKNDAIITNELLKMGIQNVLANPKNFVLLTLTRLREFFKFWPTADSSFLANILRVISFGIIFPLSILGIILSLKRWHALTPIFLFMLIHTAVYATSWTMIRYRIPLDVFLIMFASVSILFVFDNIRRKITLIEPDEGHIFVDSSL